MATLPDEKMRDVAGQVIELLGDDTNFERKGSGGVWSPSIADVKVHIRPSGVPTKREVEGVSTIEKYVCLAPFGTDIEKGDRCVVGGVYCVVKSLRDIKTHLEFELMGTNEKP